MIEEFTDTVPFEEKRLQGERRTIPGEFDPERRENHRRSVRTAADHVMALTRRFDNLANRVDEVQYTAATVKGQAEINYVELKAVHADLLAHRNTMRIRYWVGIVNAGLLFVVLLAVVGYVGWRFWHVLWPTQTVIL